MICRQTAGKCIANSGPMPSELEPEDLAKFIIKAAKPLSDWFYTGKEPNYAPDPDPSITEGYSDDNQSQTYEDDIPF